MDNKHTERSGVGVSTGSVPLFTPLLPPTITSISHEALVKWKRERREYETKLHSRCRVSGEDYAAVIQSVRDLFNADVLDTFCEMWMEKQAASVTDEMLIAEIDKIIGSVKNNTLPDIKQLFERELRMNMAESDVAARVVDYFVRFKKLITENGLSDCFDGDDGERQKCKLLVASLHPSALKDEIKQCVRYTHKPAATDTKVLFKLILERATEHDRQYHRAKKTKRDQSGRGQAETKSAPPAKKQKPWSMKPTSQPVPARPSKPQPGGKSKPAKTSSGPPAPCPKCKEMHWLSDCTKASEAEKVELRKKLREARNQEASSHQASRPDLACS